MTVIAKKNEKIQATAEALGSSLSPEVFVDKFRELYPADWDKLTRRHALYLAEPKGRKQHPVPEPTRFILNALEFYQRQATQS